MNLILLIDFGSTYTKLTAVDVEHATLVATAKAPSTVTTNIIDGLNAALNQLEEKISTHSYTITEKLASSSAAGGLRMDAIGLVPELTASAARIAALNAGAKLVGCYSYELISSDIAAIETESPDIILLAGGTDGGNQSVALHNASALAKSSITAPVVVACNRNCRDEACRILSQGGKDAIATENVLPRVNELNIEPVREKIREIFIGRIIQANGIEAAMTYVDHILMPTPTAVLNGARLLSQGTETTPGIGELILMDIGGATTDVHSVATGEPTHTGMIPKGLPEPFAKRTVEGDMGVRYNAHSILDEVGLNQFASNISLPAESVSAWVDCISKQTDTLASTEDEKKIDVHLAYNAARISMSRHTGYVETHYTPMGVVHTLFGKDLSDVKNVIGTGGPLVHSTDPAAILKATVFDPDTPNILCPQAPRFYLDSQYIMYAGGLLSGSYPELALEVMRKHLLLIED